MTDHMDMETAETPLAHETDRMLFEMVVLDALEDTELSQSSDLSYEEFKSAFGSKVEGLFEARNNRNAEIFNRMCNDKYAGSFRMAEHASGVGKTVSQVSGGIEQTISDHIAARVMQTVAAEMGNREPRD